ncbi:MAG TPA: PspC domain-containing protein [Firmicutes bacterium]|nr:PspC domain-containing protein [Candidatus Fermentithermobacillaceae bacterium]
MLCLRDYYRGGNDVEKKLYRSRTKKMIAGVCGGIAEYLNIDETVVRLGVALATVMTGIFPGVILYFIAAIIMPERPA